MKLRFTLEERTYGLYRASLGLTAFFLFVAAVAALFGLVSLQLYTIPFILFCLAIAVPIAMISCQLFGQPIWLLGDALKFIGGAQCFMLGALTGIIMQITYGYFLTEGIVAFHPYFGTLMAVTGAIRGAITFREADAMRQQRLEML